MKCIYLLLTAVALSSALGRAFAAPTLSGIPDPVNPSGIDGLVVQGTTYNVRFGPTFTSSPFLFGTPEAQAASVALAQALTDLRVSGLNGVNCTVPFFPINHCALYVDEPVSNIADAARLEFSPRWIGFPACVVGTPGCGINEGRFVTWIVATPATTATPQEVPAIRSPLALALLSLGLFGLAPMQRRSRRKSSNASSPKARR